MTNIEIISVEQADGTIVEHAVIDRGNGEYTSMPKEVYEAQVEHLTEIPTPDEA